MMEAKEETCLYCGRKVSDLDEVPPAADDARWLELARDHAADCEWVRTRAHRLPDPAE